MAIPILSDIIDGIKWMIDFFVDKVPKPLKVVFFLLLLLGFGTLIPFFLHMIGYHCNSDKVVYKAESLDFFANYGIYNEQSSLVFGDNVSFEEAHPKVDRENCVFYARNTAGYIDFCLINDTNTTGCKYYYRWGDDFFCNRVNLCVDRNWFFVYDPCSNYCYTDVFPQENDYLSTAEADCYVPEGYKWSVTEGRYLCLNQTICDEGFSVIDEKLDSIGATPLYKNDDESDKSYTNIIKLKCNDDYNPSIRILGIPIFDYKFWILMLLASVMIGLLLKIRPHSRF